MLFRSGFPLSLIPALYNIGILLYKQAKLHKYMQHISTTQLAADEAFYSCAQLKKRTY
jgi:hypothetical protein